MSGAIINSLLDNITSNTNELTKVEKEAFAAIARNTATSFSKLNLSNTETISGFSSLVQSADDIINGFEASIEVVNNGNLNVGVTQLSTNKSDLEKQLPKDIVNKLIPEIDESTQSDLKAITGSSSSTETATLNVTISSGTPEAIAAALGKAAEKLNEKLSSKSVVEVLKSSQTVTIDEVKSKINSVNYETQGNVNSKFSTLNTNLILEKLKSVNVANVALTIPNFSNQELLSALSVVDGVDINKLTSELTPKEQVDLKLAILQLENTDLKQTQKTLEGISSPDEKASNILNDLLPPALLLKEDFDVDNILLDVGNNILKNINADPFKSLKFNLGSDITKGVNSTLAKIENGLSGVLNNAFEASTGNITDSVRQATNINLPKTANNRVLSALSNGSPAQAAKIVQREAAAQNTSVNTQNLINEFQKIKINIADQIINDTIGTLNVSVSGKGNTNVKRI